MEDALGWLFVVIAWALLFIAPLCIGLGIVCFSKSKENNKTYLKILGIILISVGALPMLAYLVLRIYSEVMILSL